MQGTIKGSFSCKRKSVWRRISQFNAKLAKRSVKKMKFILFAVLLCLSVCYLNAKDPMKISLVSGRVTDRILGTKNITVSLSFFHSQNYTFTYPKVGSNKKKENSKRCFDWHSLSETIAIRYSGNSAHGLQIDASFGENFKWRRNVTIHIESQQFHGIDSKFIFYTL